MGRARRPLDILPPAAGEPATAGDPAPAPDATPTDAPFAGDARPGLVELPPDVPDESETESGPAAPPAAATMPEGGPADDPGGDAGLPFWEVSLAQHSPPPRTVRAADEASAFDEYKRLCGIVQTDWIAKVVRIDETETPPAE